MTGLPDGSPQQGGDRFPLAAVISVTFFIMFGFGLVVPTLPLFATQLGVREAGVGLVLTAFSGARLAASFFTAPILQRLGEQSTAAIGAAIVGVSSLSAGFAPTFPALVVLRGMGGVGSAFFIGALTSSLLGGVAPDRRGRAMGAFQGAVVSGFIIGPAIGGLLGRISLRAPLYIYGVICLIAAPLLLMALRRGSPAALAQTAADPIVQEDAIPPPTIPSRRKIKPLLADSAFRGALAMGFAGFFVTGGIDTLISLEWRFELGQSRSSVGIPFMIIGLASLLPTLHAGRLADSRGRKFTTIPALALSIPMVVLLGYAGSVVWFCILVGVLGATWAYQRPGPSAIVGDVTTDDNRAAAVGLLRIVNDVGGFAGPILVGVVAEAFGARAGFAVAASGAVVALLFMIKARETHDVKAS